MIFALSGLRAQEAEPVALPAKAAAASTPETVRPAETHTDQRGNTRFVRALTDIVTFFSDFDTLYVTPNLYDLSLMTIYYNYTERYTIRGSEPLRQRIEFAPQAHNRLGFYVGWQIFYLGFSFDLKDAFRHKKDKNTGTQFELSLYTSKIGIDLMHISSGNNFKIRKLHGFPLQNGIDFSPDFNGLKVDTKYLNLYYIFNNRRFSYPAAYNQSTVQRISAGSFIAGFSHSAHKFSLDCDKLPAPIREHLDPDLLIQNIRYNNISLSFGYGFNWVFARNFLANLSFSPVFSYKTSKIRNMDSEKNHRNNKFDLDYSLRAGIVYNNNKYFIGASFSERSFSYKQKDFSMSDGYGILQVYAGFNFLRKKR